MSLSPSTGQAVTRKDLLRWSGWFLFFNTPLFLLTNVRYLNAVAIPQEPLPLLFLVVSLLGHFATLAFIPFLILLPFILIIPRRLFIVTLAVVLESIATTILLLDCVVFSLYRFHLNGMVWELLTHGAAKQILPITADTYTTGGSIFAGVVLVESLLAWIAVRWTRSRSRGGKFIAAGVVLSLLAGHGLHAWADATGYNPITRLTRVFPAYFALTAQRSFERWGIKHQDIDSPEGDAAGVTSLRYPLADPDCKTDSAKPNIVYIVIDSWRYDMLNAEASPNIFRFSKEALRFNNHSAAANTTRYGIFTLFYGIPGNYFSSFLSEEQGPVLISKLLQLGYQIGVFASAPLFSPEFDQTVFSEVRQQIYLETPGDTPHARDLEIRNRFVKFIDSRDKTRPFFSFLFFDAPHGYSYPPDYPGPFSPARCDVDRLKLNRSLNPTEYRNCFLNAVNYADSLVSTVIEKLRTDGLLKNTVVVITGDHGEEFNDLKQNYWGHNNNYFKYQTQVPFVVSWPGKGAGEIDHATSHFDLTPTILHNLLKCSQDPAGYSDGLDLFDPADRLPRIFGNWDHFCVATKSRYDVFYDYGGVESFDADYNPIDTPPPAELMTTIPARLGRFYSR